MYFSFNKLTFKALILGFFIFLGHVSSFAQEVDFNKVVVPEGQRPTTFEDYLVQLAWLNTPKTEKINLEKSQEQQEVSLKRSEWMDDVNFTFNINEVSLGNVLDPQPDNLVLIPLYQFSTSVSLGSFTNIKKERRIEEVDVLLKDLEANEHKLAIRAETLARYEKLLLSIETLKVRTKAEEDATNTYELANQRFKNADLDLEDLLRASESYNQAVENRLVAETEIELAKLKLEEMIGVQWEVAKKYEERLK